ncbi:CotH kinase family protein [Akkermansiaceae bacterium]|nr:CotH kinase family protein [Akkermansiaceae bacterium]MDA7933935.1 CotH kinase family protein [Akkermansiaceae bacterium]
MRRTFVILVLLWTFPATAAPVISEFMASNETTLSDEDGDFPDWIEIFNPEGVPVDLAGYYLTDDSQVLNRWVFPSTMLGPGEWLVVFASGKDRDVGELHTDFKLSAGGEYLALVSPDGSTVVTDFGDRYPPQFEDGSYGAGGFGVGYLDDASPGAANGTGRLPGPLFLEYRTGGDRPAVAEALDITATVSGAEDVTLFYRRGFGPEEAVAMASADGMNYSVTIPGGAVRDVIRWRFVAQDADGRITKEPPFANPLDSHEYYGVPVANPDVESLAEIFEWFISANDYNRLTSFQKVRAGLYYLGEYYDNVEFGPRGQSTLFFDKKGFNIDFNKTQRFRWKEDEPRVRDINLMTNWGDKAKVRNEMAYEILREAGVPTHFAFSVRVQRNGQFFSIADLVEDADETYLDRAGLDPDGTLYKAVNTSLRAEEIGNTNIVRKMTREEEGLEDLNAMIAGINQEDSDRWSYIFDHVDLPMTINSLAGLVVIMQTDMGAKNYYLYHDTEGDGRWSILPWDLDLTFGRNFTSRAGYFDRNLFTGGFTEFGESVNTSVLVEALLRGNPRTREMFFRRLRTLSDRFIASEYIPERTRAQLERLSPASIFPGDAFLDFETWGTWYDADPVPKPWNISHPDAETMARATNRINLEWLPMRRIEIYRNTPDLPGPLASPTVKIGALDFDPISDNQDQEYIELINQSPTAIDVSDWRVDGAVRLTLPPGTVIPAGDSLFISPDVTAFRSRDLSPTGNEQRFVIGPYSGNLAAEGETLELYDPDDVLRDSHTFSGAIPGFNGDSREDLDGDGISALLEWALGTSDREFDSLPAPQSGIFRFRIRSELNGFLVVPEASSDLVRWTNEGLMLVRETGPDGFDQISIELSESPATRFVRLKLLRK